MLSAWNRFCSNISQRWIFVVMSFFGISIASALRAILAISITQMVTSKEHIDSRADERCPNHEYEVIPNSTISSDTLVPRYDWDEYTQGLILSSLFWPYGPAQMFMGPLIQRFGGKFMFGQAIFLPSFFTFLIPLAVEWKGSTALIVLRFLSGLTSSAQFPAIGAMTPHWTTPDERTRFGIICSGLYFGYIYGTTISAMIIKYWGWPIVFFFFGAISMMWLPFWLLLCYNTADENPYISENEKRILHESTKDELSKKPPPAPYRHILKSKYFWAYVVALFGCNWTGLTVDADFPKFLKSIIGLRIEVIGYVTALSNILMLTTSLASCWIVNCATSRKLTSMTLIKNVLTITCTFGSATLLLGASYVGCNEYQVMALYVVGMALMGLGECSISTQHQTLSPNYAGVVLSMANGISTISGSLSPYLIGVITTNQTMGEWRLVFWIGFVIAFFSSVFVILYVRNEVQYWNDLDPKRDENTQTTQSADVKNNFDEIQSK